MEGKSLFEKLRGLLSKLFSRASLVRIGYLAFLGFVLSGSIVFLNSVNGQSLTANISSVLGRAVSGIFNGPIAGEKFLGAVSINSDENERGSTSFIGDGASDAQAPRVRQKININTATFDELQEITGVGPATAQKIIDYRKSNNPFYKIEDIQKVSGIGPATFKKMENEITVGNITQPQIQPAPPLPAIHNLDEVAVTPDSSSVSPHSSSVIPRLTRDPSPSNEAETVNETASELTDVSENIPIEPQTESQPESTAPLTPIIREKININTAGLVELDDITGVGPVIAQKIIEHRQSVSPFYKIEDIINVNGIGEVTFQKMKDEITVGSITQPPPAPTVASEPPPLPLPPSAGGLEPIQSQEEIILININTAGLDDLQNITGVGPVIAGRIIDYRNSNGPFLQIEDIKNVSGIGPVTFKKMENEITVGD